MQRTHTALRARTVTKLGAIFSGSLLVALGLVPAAIAVAATPSISYSAAATTPFSVLTVSGTGFAPQETIALSFGLSSTQVTSDTGGSFGGAQLSVPSVPAGLYYIIAVGQSSGLVAFTSVYVNSFFPSVAPSGWYLAPGSTLTWTGSGLAPGEGITITDAQSTTVASFVADGSGAFSGAGGSVIPLSARNSSVNYTVRGAISGLEIVVPITVSDLYPSVMPSVWYAVPGTPVSFTGSGFGPSEGIDVYLGTGTVPLAHGTADTVGSFSLSGLTLPFGTSVANYRFVGSVSGVTATAPVMLASFYPGLAPSAYYAAPGSGITVSGDGFAPSESISLSVNAVAVATVSANAAGSFSPVNVTLPGTPNATATISAQGAQSGATATIGVTIGQYYPNVVPSTWFTYPGNAVSFSGSGFGPNETVVMSGSMSGTTTTDANGSFSPLASVVPISLSGNATVEFTGAVSGAHQTINIALGVRNAAIWFDNYYAQGGSPLTVFGAGFGTNETVTLSANGTSFGSGASDASGTLEVHTAIPFSLDGPLIITATGATTGVASSASLTVAPVYVDLQLASYAVAAGSPITFIGHGYLSGDPIHITTDRTGSSPVASFSADASGNFTDSSFVIPADWASGLLTVTTHGSHSMSSTSITLWVIGI